MCRSIVTLRRPEEPATQDEIRAAARQFVRKVSGYRTPSRRNSDAFEDAIEEVAAATRRLLDAVGHPDGAPAAAPRLRARPAGVAAARTVARGR